MHRRTFPAVEHPRLQEIRIRCTAHLAAERINFPHEMPFRRATNRWVAGHISHPVEVYGKNQSGVNVEKAVEKVEKSRGEGISLAGMGGPRYNETGKSGVRKRK